MSAHRPVYKTENRDRTLPLAQELQNYPQGPNKHFYVVPWEPVIAYAREQKL